MHDRHAHGVRPQLQAAHAETGGGVNSGEEGLRRADRPRRQLEEQEVRHLGALRALSPLRLLRPLRAYRKGRISQILIGYTDTHYRLIELDSKNLT